MNTNKDQSATKKKKVVVIGGGFGGVFCARELTRQLRKFRIKDLDIELISDRNYLVFHPLLPEVAAGTINAQDAVTPLRNLLEGVKIRLAEVTAIDFETKHINILQGQRRLIQQIDFDELVISSGQVTNLALFPGFEQHSKTMKDISDAHNLRNHVIHCLEMADITEFADIKQRALTFVVAGGGFSGVETMGELVEMIRRTLKYYPNISAQEVKPILIQHGSQLLPEMPAKLGAYAIKALTNRGVDVRLKTGISSASLNCVSLDNGESIDAMTIVTTIGNGPSRFMENLGLELARGKLPVSRYLQCESQPNVWALGDTALIPMQDNPQQGDFAPPTAQFAVQEAKLVAFNIIATQRETALKKFTYKPKGMLASLGNYQGVAEIFGIKVTGLAAWLIWRALYIGMLPGFATRLRVALNWLFDYFLPRTIVYIAEPLASGTRYCHYRKGDQVLSIDQIVEGFYVLVSGELHLHVANQDGEASFNRNILPGDHLGEQLLSRGSRSTCTLDAVEDSVVLLLESRDFLRLRENFSGFKDYFENLSKDRYSSKIR